MTTTHSSPVGRIEATHDPTCRDGVSVTIVAAETADIIGGGHPTPGAPLVSLDVSLDGVYLTAGEARRVADLLNLAAASVSRIERGQR